MDIRDVARRAKVSTATVSRTVNRVVTVDAQLAKRVWKAIAELGYYPNRQARALVSGRSRVFGLIVSEITNPFFPEIVQTFETLAVEKNYDILLTSTIHHLQTDLRSYNDKIDHYKHVEFRVTGPETRKRAGGGVGAKPNMEWSF